MYILARGTAKVWRQRGVMLQVAAVLILTMVILGISTPSASRAQGRAQAAQVPQVHVNSQVISQRMTPLGNMLNENGRLNLESGFSGSLDPKGWGMVDEAGKAPRFVPSQSGTAFIEARFAPLSIAAGGNDWDSTFGAGTDSTIFAIAIAINGDIYVGGFFTTAGGVTTNHIAKWNGNSWSALGSGTNNSVYAIAISGDDIYVGGIFTTAGDVTANRIARWNGSAWSALGTGMSGDVNAMAIAGNGDIYAGGWFTTAGGVTVNYIAKWNSSTWSALGSGMYNGAVWAIAIAGNGDVYAGGDFDRAGGVNGAHRIAKWDGSAWSALNSGTNNSVYAIGIAGNGDVYVGGGFSTAGDVSATNIARWNGSAWSALSSGLYGGHYAVYTIGIAGNGDVYASGGFTTAGGHPAINVAKWDGSAWFALSSGTNNDVYAMGLASNTDVYVGGRFTTAGGQPSNHIGLWRVPSSSSCQLQYTDVPTDSTFYQFVRCLSCGGIISGYPCGGEGEPCDETNDSYFRPNVNITRGQIAKIVDISAGITTNPDPQIYEDVNSTNVFYQWINRLSRAGIMGGYPCGGEGEPCGADNKPYFRLFNNATRGQLAKIVSNAAGFDDTPVGQIFADVAPDNAFYIWIQRLGSRSIMGGYACGGEGEPCDDQQRPYFRPYNDVTRGQTSRIVEGAFFPDCQTLVRR